MDGTHDYSGDSTDAAAAAGDSDDDGWRYRIANLEKGLGLFLFAVRLHLSPAVPQHPWLLSVVVSSIAAFQPTFSPLFKHRTNVD